MEIEYRASFARDLRRVRNAEMRRRVLRLIEELEQASTLTEVSSVRRIAGEGRYYRARIGDYRLGIAVEGELVILVRFLHRSDITASSLIPILTLGDAPNVQPCRY